MYLFLDIETTGISSLDRMVSVCWAFYDVQQQRISSSHHLIFPEGFSIPAGATAIHGISTERARQQGIPLAQALGALHADIGRHAPTLYVGHNVAFDKPIVLNEYGRLRLSENLSPLPTFCTMKSSTQVCCIPRFGGGYKWPKLEELHRYFFGRAHASAHDAEADVLACARCFFELQTRGFAPSAATLASQPRRSGAAPKKPY